MAQKGRAWREHARNAGLGLAAFLGWNVVLELHHATTSVLRDWVVGPLSMPPRVGVAWAAMLALLLLLNGIDRLRPRSLRLASTVVFALTACAALLDAARFYGALANGSFTTASVLPASLLVAAVFAVLALEVALAREAPRGWSRSVVLRASVAAALMLFALPLVRIFTFGVSRYERYADCAVVLGARVYDNGVPSLALADRVDEAVRLYHRGLVHTLIMSGAIDRKNGWSEPKVMRDRALAAGVPESDIVLDEGGVDSASSVINTTAIMHERSFQRVLVVSHYFHEPRLEMLFQGSGLNAYVVPAHMSRRLLKEPYFVAREVGAFYAVLASRLWS